MKPLFRLPIWASVATATATAAAAVAAVAAACYPGGPAAAYRDCRDAGGVAADLDRATETERRLTAASADLYDRLEFKEELVAGLIRGETTLAAATDRFAELDRPHPALLARQRAAFGDVGDTELAARVVLRWVAHRCPPEGEAGTPVLRARLAAEYLERFGRRPPEWGRGPAARGGR